MRVGAKGAGQVDRHVVLGADRLARVLAGAAGARAASPSTDVDRALRRSPLIGSPIRPGSTFELVATDATTATPLDGRRHSTAAARSAGCTASRCSSATPAKTLELMTELLGYIVVGRDRRAASGSA